MKENIEREKMLVAAEKAGFNMFQFEYILSVFSPEQIAFAPPEDLKRVFFSMDSYAVQKISAFMRIWLGKSQRGFWEVVWQCRYINNEAKERLANIVPESLDRWTDEELVNYCPFGTLYFDDARKILELYCQWKDGKIT